MQSSWIDKFTRGFFWFGFCVFLGASIPHIAAFYRHFDPNATPGSIQDITDWTIGYLIAIVIDVTDVLVSVAVMKELNRGTKKHHLLGYWAFIVFVMALSWLINWQYNIVYQTDAFAKSDGYQLFSVSVGAINPVIGSAFQLLLLVYTAMAHKFTVQPVKKSAEQLRQEADELEQLAMQQARIDAVKKMQNDNKVGGILDSLGQAKERAKTLFSNGQNQAIEPAKTDVEDEPKTEVCDEQNEDELALSHPSSLSLVRSYDEDANGSETEHPFPLSDPITDHDIAFDNGDIDVAIAFPVVASWLSAGRKTVTLKEIVDGSGRSPKTVKNRIAKRVIKPSGRNPDLYLIDSVIKWLKEEPISRGTGEMPAVQLVANR